MHIYNIYTIAHKTVKVFWVPCVAQGSDEALHDDPLTVVALWCKLLIVVLLVVYAFPSFSRHPSSPKCLPHSVQRNYSGCHVFPKAFIQC